MFGNTQKSTQIILGAIAIAAVVIAWSSLPSALAQTSASAECAFHNAAPQSSVEPQGSVEPQTVIILGKIPDAPYVVAVLKQDDVTLDTVRECVPDAFEARSRAGAYIRAGAFPQRSAAERLSRYLRTLNLDARVMYLP
ncbi:MAG: hypothetical protein KME15_04335 [Drouetiella hepatica Uher 2000/2452]|jgi:hypothetical protein|uniref:SPOR domain-containing protein n=1 Tax=Drouetiella hepatica Uher 2000/2452 TaxID=904376 RepID=A0A951UMN9_9CYAN|nr:hypothetical protein [Drouetiella hepatica Uher 2000/2452]